MSAYSCQLFLIGMRQCAAEFAQGQLIDYPLNDVCGGQRSHGQCRRKRTLMPLIWHGHSVMGSAWRWATLHSPDSRRYT